MLAKSPDVWQSSGMTNTPAHAGTKYDMAAPRWGDKMRTLGYYDGYMGFLSASGPCATRDVIDVGAGTAAFSEAWVAIHGAPRELTLLEPSRAMLERGQAALQRRGIEPRLAPGLLGEIDLPPADEVLAAHVIEHCADPSTALRQMRDLLRPAGACIWWFRNRIGATPSSGCSGAIAPFTRRRSSGWCAPPGSKSIAFTIFPLARHQGQAVVSWLTGQTRQFPMLPVLVPRTATTAKRR